MGRGDWDGSLPNERRRCWGHLGVTRGIQSYFFYPEVANFLRLPAGQRPAEWSGCASLGGAEQVWPLGLKAGADALR